MQVVLTRSREDAEPYARALGPAVRAIAMPVTAAAPPTADESAALAAALAHPDLDVLWLASARAVGPVVSALRPQVDSRPQVAADRIAAPDRVAADRIATPDRVAADRIRVAADRIRVYTVGPATAAAARAAGLVAESLGDDGVSAARALVARGVAGRRVLAPRAEAGRDDALEVLAAAGADVTACVAYRTIVRAAGDPEIEAGRALLVARAAAACLVFAPSQVEALAAILAADGGLAIVRAPIAIGPTTAAALAARGVAAAAVAATPTPQGMAAALAAVYPPAP